MPAKKLKTKNVKPKTTAGKSVSKASKFSVPVFNLAGKKKETYELPKEIFGAKVNEKLMAQAVRVYLANKRQGNASTKTRGEVTGSTRKIYRQKGTGRARHGSIKAPIFVGGGIVFGPRPHSFRLKLSKQMKRQALLSALTQKFLGQNISVVDPKGASGKTKEFASMFKTLNIVSKKQADNLALFVTDGGPETKKAVRNIEGVTLGSVGSMNTYEVLVNKHLIFDKGAISNLVNHFVRKGKTL